MAENKKVLVIGGGMSGLTAAIETAEAGFEACIVEKNPYLGGRVAQINKYFWKLYSSRGLRTIPASNSTR
jgi:quinone-modifying oxidoreductase subunit QmoA